MQSVRPKRRPAYLEDYEVDMAGFMEAPLTTDVVQRVLRQHPEQFVAGADASPIADADFSRLSRSSRQRWNTTVDEWHLSPDRSICPADSTQPRYFREPFQATYQMQMDEIHKENVKLHETQRAVRADIARLQAAKDDLVMLMEKACHLSPSGSSSDSVPVQQQSQSNCPDDEEWPAPPPWIPPDIE